MYFFTLADKSNLFKDLVITYDVLLWLSGRGHFSRIEERDILAPMAWELWVAGYKFDKYDEGIARVFEWTGTEL